jgi:hypothetical protein
MPLRTTTQHTATRLASSLNNMARHNAKWRSLKVHDESLHCEWGLVSRSGWAVVDDTTNWGLTKGAEWWDSVNTDAADL